jgi:hypothetical protein
VETVPGQQRGAASGDPPSMIVGGYVLLLVFGILLGMIGSFQYSRALGSFPAAAVGFAVGIGVAAVLASFGMRRPLGGLMTAVGWFVASLVLAMGTPGGSVLIANTTAGKWYLLGGSVCAVAGVLISFVLWSPARVGASRPRRSLPRARKRDR